MSRRRVFELLEIAGPQDRASRICDVALITLIALNVGAAMLESVPAFELRLRDFFRTFEAISVAIFTIEYVLRLWSVVESRVASFRRPVTGRLRYAVTPIAVIDLLAVLPFYAAAFATIDLRFLRVLRILRILKLSHYFSALNVLLDVIRSERHAFGAAFFLLALGVLFAASGIYVFEHEAQPDAFGSIPAAMWWALVTLTTVGYGDVTPITAAGKLFGASITIMGIGMVALPTGILAAGFEEAMRRRRNRYEAEMDAALEDGVIDAEEHVQLERLRERLGLSQEDVQEIAADRTRERSMLQRGGMLAPPAVHKCPGCGEEIEAG